jgi:peptide/nickel transport system substrate-binding protein
MWQVVGAVGFLFFMGSLFAGPCSAAPKGKAVVVSREIFVMNGGDCHTSWGTGAIHIGNLIHEGLVRKHPDGHYVPALAKSWEILNDGLIIKFTLNERAKFHNGEPVTANDVKFSFERGMRPELKFRLLGPFRQTIDRIEVIDNHHLTIYFKVPFPGLFEYSAQFFGIVPKAYVEKVGDAEFAKHPIGAGPFKWVDYQQDVFIKAEAVADHYRKPPTVKTLEFKFAVDDATLMAMFKAGEADLVQLPLAIYKDVMNDPKLKVVWAKYFAGFPIVFADLAFPNEPSPFHDVRVRRAASYAINRKAICEKVLHGAAEPWGDVFAPYHPGVNLNLKPHPYDPEKAKALLKEAGYPNGFDTTFTSGHPAGDKLDVQAIAADLARVGIKGKIVELEAGTYVRNLREKKLRGIFRGPAPWWTGHSHPGVATESAMSSENFWTYVTTPEIDTAWKKLYTLTDEKAIAAQAKELSRIWHESEIKYMLWTLHQPFGISPRVKSYKPVTGWMQTGLLENLELKD